MALYVSACANVFQVACRTDKNGKVYATCTVAFYSNSKDKDGKYTVEDPKFTVKATAFGDNAQYLSTLPSGKGFVSIQGKLYDASIEKEDDSVVYFKKFDIMRVAEGPKSANNADSASAASK